MDCCFNKRQNMSNYYPQMTPTSTGFNYQTISNGYNIPSFPTTPTSQVLYNTPATVAPVLAPTVANINYTQGYLKTQIGKKVRVDFLIGTNMLVDKAGTLMEVGTSYIVLKEADSDDLLLCDLYAIKFVLIYY